MVDHSKAGAAIKQALGSSKPAPLGRGLSALFGDADTSYQAPTPVAVAVAASNNSQRHLPVGWLQPGQYQPRRDFSDAALVELAESIRAHGVLQPLLVRPLATNRYEIIAGERRWRAAQQAGVHEVPVVVRELSDADALEIALIENIQRQDLSPLEEAEAYQRLVSEFHYSQEDLGKAVSKSRSHVANMLRLLQLPDPIKQMLRDQQLSAGHARALLNAAAPVELARQAVAEKLSVREVEERVRLEATLKNGSLKNKTSKTGSASAQVNADVLALEKDLAAVLGLKVKLIAQDDGSGSLTMHYQDLDQLDAVIAKLRA